MIARAFMLRSVILIVLGMAVCLAVVAAAGGAKNPDPRICGSHHSHAQCGATAAKQAVIGYVESHFPGIDLPAIQCHAHAGLLRYSCKWRTTANSGLALVTFAPVTFESTVKITG